MRLATEKSFIFNQY